VLDEDEEGVLQVVSRELEAARNLGQLQRAVAEEAVAHLLREEIRGQELGRQTHGSTQGMTTGGEEVGRELTATRGPKWSEMMPTARRMPFCDTMVAGGEEDMGVGVLGCGCDGGRAAATAAAPSEKKLRTEAGCGCANEAGRAGSTCADGPEAVRTVSQGHRN
jgi:hypothetical protein